MSDDKPSDDDLVIRTKSRIFVTIKPDGRLVYGEGYTPDEAAAALWEALARKRVEAGRVEPNAIRLATPEEVGLLEMEARFNEWERALLVLARADAACEIAQFQRNLLVGDVPDTSPEMRRANAKVVETENYRNEMAVRVVELARAHAKRKGILRDGDYVVEIVASTASDEPQRTSLEPDPKRVLN